MEQPDHTPYVKVLGGLGVIARRLGIKPPSTHGWKTDDGRIVIPDARLIQLGAEIERLSEGRFSRRAMRPTDWHLIWPELAESQESGAPAPQAVAAGEGADA